MTQTATIYLVEGSTSSSLSLAELKEMMLKYREQTSLTGQQLGWSYEEAAFPYTLTDNPDGDPQWFYLKGTNPLYKYIVLGVGSKQQEDQTESFYVQVVLPHDCTHGDKAKGNEFCKYLGKHLKGEVHLFNGRTMYYNPRKL